MLDVCESASESSQESKDGHYVGQDLRKISTATEKLKPGPNIITAHCKTDRALVDSFGPETDPDNPKQDHVNATTGGRTRCFRAEESNATESNQPLTVETDQRAHITGLECSNFLHCYSCPPDLTRYIINPLGVAHRLLHPAAQVNMQGRTFSSVAAMGHRLAAVSSGGVCAMGTAGILASSLQRVSGTSGLPVNFQQHAMASQGLTVSPIGGIFPYPYSYLAAAAPQSTTASTPVRPRTRFRPYSIPNSVPDNCSTPLKSIHFKTDRDVNCYIFGNSPIAARLDCRSTSEVNINSLPLGYCAPPAKSVSSKDGMDQLQCM
ncbi:T-box transcription factor TBX3-like [Oncorhynchus mykiss]|uniref:T-box transcription factor TBX3-like n=1 Tax=Oncorhynchus mykiss TaxID=8022 RepID=UPI001878E8F8|nr:T-box transcription factor TBX3-like [Oncorhynchus mykiss]